jgi:hypothetical protein
MIKLSNQISEDFVPENIDWHLVRQNRLTLLGIWLIDEKSKYLKYCDEVMDTILNTIKNEPNIKEIEAEIIRMYLPIPPRTIKICLTLLSDFGFFNGGASDIGEIIFNKVSVSNDSNIFRKLLRFKDIEQSTEQFFNDFNNYKSKNVSSVKKQTVKNFEDDFYNVWNKISLEFKVTKQAFGKKINFVTDKNKRLIIFRDVEQAYHLSKTGFYKPAIILAGGVIEELLRIYLDFKNIKPKSNTFDEYIKSCETNKLLTKAVSTLTDSQRHFRNFVHLEKEKNINDIKSSMAQGAVASIFTIVNEF